MPRKRRRRLFGKVYSRKDAAGVLTWYAQWKEHRRGRRITRAIGTNKKAAEAFLAEVEQRVRLGTYTTPPSVAQVEASAAPMAAPPRVELPAFVDFARRILDERIGPNLADKTVELYEGNLAALAGWFGSREVTAADGSKTTIPAKRLDELRASDFHDFRAWRRTNCRWRHGATVKETDAEGNVISETPREVSNATINRDHHFAGLVLGHAVADGLLPSHPLARVRAGGGRSTGVAKLREAEGRRAVLSKGEVAGLILACEPQLRPLVLTALFTGCRKGELLALRWRDVSFERGKVTVYREKDKSADELDLHPVLAEELRRVQASRKSPEGEGPEPEAVVFLNRYKQPWKDPRAAWKRALKNAGLAGRPGLVFHSLRATFATHFLEGGGAITDLQAQLGHSKITTTQRYARMVNERRRTTVLALDFGTKPKEAAKAETQVEKSNTESNTSAAAGS
jgi:integrase